MRTVSSQQGRFDFSGSGAGEGPDSLPGGPTVAMGIDENGLGPRLGPLIVTGVWARISEKGHEHLARPFEGTSRLGDSKRLVAYGRSSLGEAWGRVLLERNGRRPECPAEVLTHLSDVPINQRMAMCPTDHAPQCWGNGVEAFSSSESLLSALREDAEALAAAGIELLEARCVFACTRLLNGQLAAGHSRFDVDLHSMEKLILLARDAVGVNLDVTCGKVGGYERYVPAFGHLGHARQIRTIHQERARSEYDVEGVGTVRFVRDADGSNLLVGLASLIGKWVRDHFMSRIVRFYRSATPDLPNASGYHDPRTALFVAMTEKEREAKHIESDCFERAKAAPKPSRTDQGA